MENYKNELINRLSSACGIVNEYWDILGNRHIASMESRCAALQAMGYDTNSEETLSKALEAYQDQQWLSLIQPVFVMPDNHQPFSVPIHIQVKSSADLKLSASWELIPEGSKTPLFTGSASPNAIEEKVISGRRYIKTEITCPSPSGTEGLAPGYYGFVLSIEAGQERLHGKSMVIVTPERCYMPPQIQDRGLWGVSLNLYSLRSRRNWGVGDFSDLEYCIEAVKRVGGAFVGINPLHDVTNESPFGISPYSPISKLYRNLIYIDLDAVEGFKNLRLNKETKEEIERLRNSERIDYESVARLKFKLLKRCFDIFYKEHIQKETALGRDLEDYIDKQGRCLESFALYHAIAEHEGIESGSGKKLYSWRQWHSDLQKSDSDAAIEFKKRHRRDVLFYCYIQWIIDRQLRGLSEAASGLSVGIYNDLAIGSIKDGSDEWVYQDVFASGVSVGAPPDDFNPLGQNWGFPPLCPHKLRRAAYEPLIMGIRKNMQYAGALRIDHALGLFRMFWIPEGSKASDGVYVEYPSEDILGIIALESHLNKTIVIAEDLGTITDQAREALSRYSMLSYRLLYFQRNYPSPSFVMPEDYPAAALCAVTTHDLPTIYGYWEARDIELRKRLGLIKDDLLYQDSLNKRKHDKKLLLEALVRCGIISGDIDTEQLMDSRLMMAVYEFLARSRSRLLAVSLDDLMGTLDQQNMPGTVDEYPCWVQKTPIAIEDFLNGYVFDSLGMIFKANNRANKG